MSRTEQILAEEARQLVSSFSFDTRKPKNQDDLRLAKILYKEIFYDQAFYRVKSKNFSLHFNSKIFPKIESCSKCAKIAHEQLRDFANKVLD